MTSQDSKILKNVHQHLLGETVPLIYSFWNEKVKTKEMNLPVKRIPHRIHICYLPGGRSVTEKTVPEVLSTARGRRPRAILKTKGTVFSHICYTDRPRPVNNLFIFFCLFAFFPLGRV